MLGGDLYLDIRRGLGHIDDPVVSAAGSRIDPELEAGFFEELPPGALVERFARKASPGGRRPGPVAFVFRAAVLAVQEQPLDTTTDWPPHGHGRPEGFLFADEQAVPRRS